MSESWDDYIADRRRTTAVGNVAQGQGVQPQAAVDAIAVAPATGVPAVAGMHDVEPLKAQAQEKANNQILVNSPSVAGFVASDPVRAAAVKDDYAPLAKVGALARVNMSLADYINQGGPIGDIVSSAKGGAEMIAEGRALGQKGDTLSTLKGAGLTVLGTLGVLGSPFMAVGEPIARLVNKLPASTYSVDLAKRGQPQLPEITPEEKAESSEFLGGLLSGIVPLPRLPPLRYIPRGVVDEGTIGANAPRLPGPVEHVPDAEFVDINPPNVDPTSDLYHNIQAQVDAAHVSTLQVSLIETATHSRAPDLVQDFLAEHTAVGGQEVSVPPEAITDLWAKGHSVFSGQLDAVHQALISGGNVQIPLAQYLTETAGKPFAEELNKVTQFREGGISVEEASALPQEKSDEGGVEDQALPPIEANLPKDVVGDLDSGDMVHYRNPKTGEYLTVQRKPDGQYQLEHQPFPIDKMTQGATVPPNRLALNLEGFEPIHAASIRTIAANAELAVDQVFKESALDKLFQNPSAAGLTKGQLGRYSAQVEEAQAALHDKLLQRTYTQLRRELTPEWKAQVEARSEELKEQINALPVVQAHRALSQPGFKLDRDLTENFFPEPASRLHPSVVRRGGNHPDEVADFVGYPSGGQLVSDLADLHTSMQSLGTKGIEAFVKKQALNAAASEARYNLGYDTSKESLLNLARELVAGPEVEDLLTQDLREFSETNGLPFSKAEVEQLAEEQFSGLTVREATKPKTFAENMRRLGNKAEAALIDGKPIDAFKFKQQQLLQFLQMKAAFSFQKEFAKANKAMTTVARKPINPKMDQIARNHLRDIVRQLGFSVREGKFENVQSALKGQTLEGYGRALTARGQPVYITDIPAIGPGTNYPNGLPDLIVDQFRDVNSMFKSIADLGRQEMTVEVEGRKIAMAELAGEVKANADAIGRPYTAGEAQRAKGKVKVLDLYKPREVRHLMEQITANTGRGARTLGAATTRSEVPLFWLDRETNGPLMKSIVNPLNDGAYYKAEKIQALSTAFKEFVKGQPKGWGDSLTTRVDVPELVYGKDANGDPVPWIKDKGNLILVALHTGTEDNFANLVEGFGWDPLTVQDVLARELTPADWHYVDFLWDQMQTLWPEVQELYRTTVGLAPKEIVGREVYAPGVGKLQGRYWPLDYDWSAVGEHADGEGGSIEVHDPMALGESDLFGNDFRVATPPNGSTKQRTQFRGPLNLDHSTLHRHFESVVHDLAFRKPLIQAAKVLRDPAVRSAIKESLGPEYLKRIEGWLQQIARQSQYDQTALRGLAGALNGLRRRFTIFQIGYNFLTMAKHGGIALSHMAGEGGAHLPGALADLIRDNEHWTRFIDENSGEVRNTMVNLDRDVREVMERNFTKQGFLSNYQYHATTLFGVIKRWEAQRTWLAKYREIHESGATHEDAVAIANKAVRDTQGSGSIVNLTALQAPDPSLGGAVLKLLNIFTTFENTATNRMWTVNRRMQRANETVKRQLGLPNGRGFDGFQDEGWAGARRDYTRNLVQLLAFIVAPPLLLTALDEVTGKHGMRASERFLEHFMQGSLGGTLPGGNILAGLPHLLATKGRDIGGDEPIQSVLKSTSSSAVDAWDAAHGHHVADKRWVQHAIETTGYTTGMPLKPVARAGQFAYDKSNGRTPPGWWNDLRGALFGPSALSDSKSSSSSESRHK